MDYKKVFADVSAEKFVTFDEAVARIKGLQDPRLAEAVKLIAAQTIQESNRAFSFEEVLAKLEAELAK